MKAAIQRPADKSMHVILTSVDASASFNKPFEVCEMFIFLTPTLDATTPAFLGSGGLIGTGELLSYLVSVS